MSRLVLSSVAVALAASGLAAEQAGSRVPSSIPNMAGKIMTVTGPIDPSQVGPTIMHEHVFIDMNAPGERPDEYRWGTPTQRYFGQQPPQGATGLDIFNRPLTMDLLHLVQKGYPNRDNWLLLDEATAIEEVKSFKSAGGTTIVDVTSIGLRRDPPALKRVAEATGLQIVMGASWYQKAWHPPDMDQRTVESLTDEIVADVTAGVGNTGIRAGIIGEVGTVGGPLTPNEIKVIQASGRASGITGAAITVHTSALLHEQPRIIDLMVEAGADPSRIVIGHSNPLAADVPFMKQLLAKGVYIQFDTLGRTGYAPGSRIDDADVGTGIAELVKAGFADRILLSQDVCTKMHLKQYGGTGYAYVLEYFVPYLKQLGVGDADIEKMLVTSPRKVLTFVAPAPARATE